MIASGQNIKGAKVGVLGLTFKENCPDLRNSKVVDIIAELESYGVQVLVHDPMADPAEAREHYGIDLVSQEALKDLGALVIAVAHEPYKAMSAGEFQGMLCEGGHVVDVKSMVEVDDAERAGLNVWRL
jgi:UDP-N-acetyl-D-galactosamine dehydrogenase